jgi:long-chain acyl-CoA synthetase
MERVILISILLQKGKIGFFHGNVAEMKEDLVILKPTILLSVPRILNKLADTIKSKI